MSKHAAHLDSLHSHRKAVADAAKVVDEHHKSARHHGELHRAAKLMEQTKGANQ